MHNAADAGRLESVRQLVGDLFSIDSIYHDKDTVKMSLSPIHDPELSRKLLEDRLRLGGYDFDIKSADEHLLLSVKRGRRITIPLTNVILFVLTLISVYFVPVFLRHLTVAEREVVTRERIRPPLSWQEEFKLISKATPLAAGAAIEDMKRGRGLEFAIAIMSILLVHEMGHYIAGRRRGVVTSWPYFIPAPNIIGTFGAVIKSKSPFWNRRDLIEMGAAGPIFGWIVAIGWLFYGLSQSEIVSIDQLELFDNPILLQGESMLIKYFAPKLLGELPPDHAYNFTEAAFAGWVGLLVTAINMLPVGQLDGGHITYGLFRRRQYALGWMAMLGLIVMGFQSPMWWMFACFGIMFGVGHPPTIEDEKRPSGTAIMMGLISLFILLLSFTPIPFR